MIHEISLNARGRLRLRRIEPKGKQLAASWETIVNLVARIVFKIVAIVNKECHSGGHIQSTINGASARLEQE